MSARLSAVPSQRERGLGIIRVSKIGNRAEADLHSPEIQRHSIEEHAARSGIDMVEWVEALDESGSQERSKWWPRLDAAIERIEQGHIDVIVVWKFNRAGRHPLKREMALHRVKQAGGRIESATEPTDATTPVGTLTRGMIGQVDDFYAALIGESWKNAQAARIRRGLPATGRPRFGYAYDTEQKLHVPDPVTGQLLSEMYTRFTTGESVYTLIAWLNTTDVRPVDGYGVRTSKSLWSDRTIRRILDSGFAAGLLHVHDPECQRRHGNGQCPNRIHVPGAHEPLIDQDLWEEYLTQRAARRITRTTERSTYLLSGLLRCTVALPDGEICGAPMGGSLSGHNGRARYVCNRSRAFRAHSGGAIVATKVEPVVMEWLHQLADGLEPAIASEQAVSADRAVDMGRLERQVEAAKEKLVSATRLRLEGEIPDVAWPTLRAEIEEQLRALEARHAALQAAARRPMPEQIAADALADWTAMPIEHRRGTLRQLIKVVQVETGPTPTVRVVPSWEDAEDQRSTPE